MQPTMVVPVDVALGRDELLPPALWLFASMCLFRKTLEKSKPPLVILSALVVEGQLSQDLRRYTYHMVAPLLEEQLSLHTLLGLIAIVRLSLELQNKIP